MVVVVVEAAAEARGAVARAEDDEEDERLAVFGVPGVYIPPEGIRSVRQVVVLAVRREASCAEALVLPPLPSSSAAALAFALSPPPAAEEEEKEEAGERSEWASLPLAALMSNPDANDALEKDACTDEADEL